MNKVQIIKSYINIGKYEEFIYNLLELSKEKDSSYVCISNVHMTIETNDSDSFVEMVDDVNIVTPNGIPIVKAMKLLHGINYDRVVVWISCHYL